MTTNVNKTLWDNPVNNPKISSPYGWRTHPIQNTKKHHNGVDIAIPQGTSVKAQAEGVVEYAGLAGGYGNLIIINHSDEFLSAYAHNDALLVSEGQKVVRGQQVARMGSTDAKSTRLHFEIRYRGQSVNPLSYLPK